MVDNDSSYKKTYANNGNIILIEHHHDRDLNKKSNITTFDDKNNLLYDETINNGISISKTIIQYTDTGNKSKEERFSHN